MMKWLMLISKTASLAKEPKSDINYVYTAMHGVGYEVLSKTLTKAGLPQPHIVAEQVWPDGTFPTVNFLTRKKRCIRFSD